MSAETLAPGQARRTAAGTALREAINAYHELLSEPLALETAAQLDAQQRQRGLFFGERPICTVLRPRFLTATQYRFLQSRAAVVLEAFGAAYSAALQDPGVLAQFRLTPWEEELVEHDPGFPAPSPVSRLDAFFVSDTDGLRFTEYNAETPAGSAYNDVLSEVFYGLPVMREYLRRWDLRPLPARHNVLNALLDAYRRWSGRRDTPRIAILDWSSVPTRSEFLLFQDYFRRQGVPCVIVDPAEVELRGGQLVAGDMPVDLLYKRVLISELVGRCGLDHPVIRAVREGRVCMVNPFRCKILHKKASLAVLSDERNAHLFSPAQREAIDEHIPWTRLVEDRRTLFHGVPVDLLTFAAGHREQLVLKPNDEYGGTGIVLGWEVSPGAWENAIRKALEEPHIVQERVPVPTEPYPVVADGALSVSEMMLDTAPYVAYGAYVDGCLTRLSTATLLNVSAGGGSTVPTFVVERRLS